MYADDLMADKKVFEEGKKKVKKIVRLINTDIDGNLPLVMALQKIKGIGKNIAKVICIKAGFDYKIKLQELDETQLKNIEEIIKHPDIPDWLKNRRKDRVTQKNEHLISSKVDIKLREDITRLKKIRAYKGIRHQHGLPVRGQRTRGSFRKNKTVGVQKKKALAARAGKSK